MNSVHNLESLIKIQHFVKSKVRILISLRKEVEYIHSIIRHVLYRLEQSSQLGIVRPKDYKKFMLRIGESNRDMASIHLQRQKCYTAQLTLARVKLSIIQIMKQIGSKEVSDILSFILSFSQILTTLHVPIIFMSILLEIFLSCIFIGLDNPATCIKYFGFFDLRYFPKDPRFRIFI